MPEQQIPEGSVVITPTQIYDRIESIRDEVKHLSAVVDPALQQVRTDIAENASRIELIIAERKAADAALDLRVRFLESAGYVTGARMWTALGVLATIVAALVAVYVVIR